jgi:hypothetical protein
MVTLRVVAVQGFGMIKKITLLLSLACMLLLSPLAGQAQPDDENQQHGSLIKKRAPLEADSSVELREFKGDSVLLKYPAGWELISDVPKPRIFHVKTMGGRVNASITVQEISSGLTLDQYRDATTRDIESDAKDLNPKKVAVEKSHLGEIDAWKLIYSINVPNTQPPLSAKQTLFVAVKGNRGYLLCCTAFDALPGKFDSIFRLMADSLRFAPGALDKEPAKAL